MGSLEQENEPEEMCCKDWHSKSNGRFSSFPDTQMICKAFKVITKYLKEHRDNSFDFVKRNKVNKCASNKKVIYCISFLPEHSLPHHCHVTESLFS